MLLILMDWEKEESSHHEGRVSPSKNLEKEVDRVGVGKGQQPRHLDLVLTPVSFLFCNHLQTVK